MEFAKKAEALAAGFADVEVDSRGRVEYRFDGIGLALFAARVVAAWKEEQGVEARPALSVGPALVRYLK